MEWGAIIAGAAVAIFAAGFFVGKKHGIRLQRAIDAIRNTAAGGTSAR